MLKKKNIEISIQDFGPGIDQKDQSKIFEKFTILDNYLYHKEKSTGLGLNITRQLVKKLGGKIKLKSQLGQGSNFIVILPLSFPYSIS